MYQRKRFLSGAFLLTGILIFALFLVACGSEQKNTTRLPNESVSDSYEQPDTDPENNHKESFRIPELISLSSKAEFKQLIELLKGKPEDFSDYIQRHNGNAFGLSAVPDVKQREKYVDFFKAFHFPNHAEMETWGLVCHAYLEELTFGFTTSTGSAFWISIMPFIENPEAFLRERARINDFNLVAIENNETDELYYGGVKESFGKNYYYYYGIENGRFFYITSSEQEAAYRDEIVKTMSFDSWDVFIESREESNFVPTAEGDDKQSGSPPPEVLVFRAKEEFQDFLSLGALTDSELEETDGTWNGLYYLDRERYNTLSTYLRLLPVPKQEDIVITSLTVHPGEELSSVWGASVTGGNAIFAFVSTKEGPMDALKKSAEKNQMTLQKMENSAMQCLFFCEQHTNEMLTMYYGVVDDYFFCASFVRTEKSICDRIVTTLRFEELDDKLLDNNGIISLWFYNKCRGGSIRPNIYYRTEKHEIRQGNGDIPLSYLCYVL